MNIQKLSISLSEQQCAFIERYKQENHCSSRSDVIKQAIYLLEQNYLELCYKEASKGLQELENDFDITTAEGLEDETW